MKKLGPKEICAAIVAAGIALCVVIYVLVFNKYKEETETLKASNNALEVEVNDLKQYFDNIPTYKKNMEEMRALINEVTADYPGDAREEDTIMMAVTMQGVAPVNFDSINISSQQTIYSVPQETVKQLHDETLQTDIRFNMRQATYNCTTLYSGLKDVVARIYDDKYRIAVNSVSFAKDSAENNYITGIIDISYYSLDGMNKEYVKPQMSEYIAGTQDFFRPTIVDGERVTFINGEE